VSRGRVSRTCESRACESRAETVAAPSVSVLLFCRDDVRFVASALASVAAQRGVDCELIVVDEGLSASGEEKLQASLEAGAVRVGERVDARGCSPLEAFARGAAAAHHDVVAGLEAADSFAPDRLETLLAAAAEAPAGRAAPFAACSRLRFIDAVGDPVRATSEARRRYEATLLPDGKVVMEGETYSSPFNAYNKGVGVYRNGWKKWLYDADGTPTPIDALRTDSKGFTRTQTRSGAQGIRNRIEKREKKIERLTAELAKAKEGLKDLKADLKAAEKEEKKAAKKSA